MGYGKTKVLLGAALAGLALLAGCGGGSSGDNAPPQPQPLNWTSCDDVTDTQCAFLQVPVDHANPSGAKISLRLARVQKAVNQATNLGMLLIIPGGPGVGISNTFGPPPNGNRANFHIDDFFSKHFDVVSFDPRGVGESNPIQCSGAIPTPIAPFDSAPTSDQFAAIGAANAALTPQMTSRAFAWL
jgi:pimeloyl-ACP methyl ester carboxylesterase